MNDIEITKLDLVEGGNVFKQGHYLTLGYAPRDPSGELVNLEGKDIAVSLYNRYGASYEVSYETTATFDAGTLRFDVKTTIPSGETFVEFTATDPNDESYRMKFPTNPNAAKLSVVPSTDDLGNNGITIYTVSKLLNEQKKVQQEYESTVDGKLSTVEQRLDDGIGAFTEDTEIIDARMGETNLRAFNEKTTAQLADIAVNVRSFGAVGDGVVDDSDAIEAAFESKKNLIFNGIYRITRPILSDFEKDVKLSSEYESKLVFDSESHAEYFVRLRGSGVKFTISNLIFDGMKKCNNVLGILNPWGTMDDKLSTLYVDKCHYTNAKRDKAFTGGSGLYVQGGFDQVNITNSKVNECELPIGQGTPSVVGINGISIGHANGLYTLNAVIDNVLIEKIYSSDPDYEADQDGVHCLTPGTTKSFLLVKNSKFKNCFGRSIKSQFTHAHVKDCSFYRDTGFTSKKGNPEVDLQRGGSVESCTYSYNNGYRTSCVSGGSLLDLPNPRLTAKDCIVFLDESTTLEYFASTYPRDGFMGSVKISDITVHGTCNRFFSYLVNGNKNKAVISNIFIDKIETFDGTTPSLVQVIASGTSSPYIADLTIHDCEHGGINKVAVVDSRIAGVLANAYISAYQNTGFIDDAQKTSEYVDGLKERQGMRIGRMLPAKYDIKSGAYEIYTHPISPNTTITIPIRNIQGALIDLTFNANVESFASFYSYGNDNKAKVVGSSVDLITSGEPATFNNIFTVWSTTNEIKIHNTNSSTRYVTMTALSTS